MAIENIEILDASGETRKVAADQIGEDQYAQVVKQAYGADGTLTLMDEEPSTAALQGTSNETLASILAKLIAAPATEGTVEAMRVLLAAGIGVTGPLTNAEAAALGIATEAKLEAVRALLAATLTVSGGVSVSNFPATQPVSGTFWQTTQPVSLATAPALVAGESHVGEVGGRTVTIRATATRTSDTTTYTAGDVVGATASAVIAFAGCSRLANGSGVIMGARLLDEANQTLKGQFELWLFDTAITAVADNAVWIPTHAEMEASVAIVQFLDTPVVGLSGAGVLGNVIFSAWNINRPFNCTGAGTTLYGYIVVRNAYVPISAEKFQVTLGILQD